MKITGDEWLLQDRRFLSVTVFVTARVPCSNITGVAAENATGWPVEIRGRLLRRTGRPFRTSSGEPTALAATVISRIRAGDVIRHENRNRK
jgi:predicted amidohydrolase